MNENPTEPAIKAAIVDAYRRRELLAQLVAVHDDEKRLGLLARLLEEANRPVPPAPPPPDTRELMRQLVALLSHVMDDPPTARTECA